MGKKFRRAWGTAGDLEQLSAQIPGDQKKWVEETAERLHLSPSEFVEQMINLNRSAADKQLDGLPPWAIRPQNSRYTQEEALPIAQAS
ncbi:hypothetical protein CVS27_17110 [Arthrobacter glacialis]|uniref:Uncharacterized protein n=1 Tax=Arthrobacter glacialis TaxID=1664 RepID=A0A2S3ZSI1_ARTGL|nr:hypothetical protein CVS27_17110 [Arthrobacter glacialis]